MTMPRLAPPVALQGRGSRPWARLVLRRTGKPSRNLTLGPGRNPAWYSHRVGSRAVDGAEDVTSGPCLPASRKGGGVTERGCSVVRRRGGA